jgi:hypothetical protein
MANNLNTSPVYIDDVGADITISTTQTKVSMISVTEDNSAAAKVVFIDNDSAVVAIIQVGSGETAYWTPSEPFLFSNGLIYDDSASSVDDGDIILVYEV